LPANHRLYERHDVRAGWEVHRIGEEIFLFAPVNVTIDAETARSWHEEEIFS